MRAFYTDLDETVSRRTYYVKIGNVNLPDDLKGYKSIEADDTKELINKIIELYKFPTTSDKIQLWSNQMYGGIRLDKMPVIPIEHEFVWVRVLQ